jgi:hypothetical protein
MAGSSTVSGTGNTTVPGMVTVAPGNGTSTQDDATVPTTIAGSGGESVSYGLGTPGSTVPTTLFTNGGSGTVSAGGSNAFVFLSGSNWSVQGSSSGADSVNSNASNATVGTSGNGAAVGNATNRADTTPSNVVGLAGTSAIVNSSGSNDLIESYSGSDTVNVTNSANVLVNGGAVTVNANGPGPVIAFFNSIGGGTLDFINNSSVAATVSGNIPGGGGGSATAFGGVGGGVYIGGSAGNNSLVGGSGAVTLVGAGTNNYLEAAGFSSTYAGQNVLKAGSGGGLLVADSTTGYNEFFGGSGTSTIISAGKGAQTFYVGSSGSERITGSTVAGSTNEYIFDQDSTGSGSDVITNFRLGKDHIDINLNGTLSGVTIKAIDTLGGGVSGSLVSLSDGTSIQLYGVKTSSLSTSIIGGTHI